MYSCHDDPVHLNPKFGSGRILEFVVMAEGQILGKQKALVASGGAKHYYLPIQISYKDNLGMVRIFMDQTLCMY